MSLSFVQMQNAVLADAFAESKRSDAKEWIRFRHAWLWDLHSWSFKYATDTVTVTNASQTVTGMPDDFGSALSLIDARGSALAAVPDVRHFYELYNTNLGSGTSTPEAFTVLDGTILVGPTSNETSSTYVLLYEKLKPALVADIDMTGLPDGYDLALVHGGKAEGFKLSNVPLADAFDADFQAAIKALEAKYLTETRVTEQWGSYCGQWG